MTAYTYEITGVYVVVAAPNSAIAWKLIRKKYPGGSPKLQFYETIPEDGGILCQITNKRGTISCESGHMMPTS
jgi:hypothetical protein